LDPNPQSLAPNPSASCPCEFSVLPAGILGQVYEQFLAKVIRLTPSHQANVEEKPEVRKAGLTAAGVEAILMQIRGEI